jgi:hypothetical protein
LCWWGCRRRVESELGARRAAEAEREQS